MRTLAIAVLLIAAVAIPATAEPPPQAVASAPAQTVSDANFRRDLPNAAAAYVVGDSVFLDTAKVAASSSTAVVDTPRVAAEKSGGHGLGFWAVIVALLGIAGVLAYRFITRDKREPPNPRATSEELPDRTRPPGSSGRGSGKS